MKHLRKRDGFFRDGLLLPGFANLGPAGKRIIAKDKQRACIVDLNEITFIDKSGERLLRLLVKEGAQCIATGDYAKHVLEKLTRSKDSVFSRLSGFFFAIAVAVFPVRH